MPRYIISLGSNIQSGATEIQTAIEWLAGLSELIASTPVYSTPDAYDATKPCYANAIAVISCRLDAEKLTASLKEYEASRGRVAGSKEVVIDLDLVCRETEILRHRDYSAPYFVEGLYLLTSGGIFNR
ncbi:MAG: 2-amino-4-hydroxy-6-hydroxymethyldihydropteridine diphosphokinase [Muribaculaceae bacterium]|nr:2-amino-4-hydroxy-6-hydroxymethyldihydropteridine diphosphokinase [Muribaculaceae bacterium]